MNFDKIISKAVQGCRIRYGIVYGNETIVFIKTGADGSIKGSQDKYLKMAQRLKDMRGFTVICASNPCECDASFRVDHKVIDEYVTSQGFSSYKVYLVGTSDGAYSNLSLASLVPQTVKYLGINTSTVDFSAFLEKLHALPLVEKLLVYGTEDDEFANVAGLHNADVKNLAVIPVEGADHGFRGMLDAYIALVDLLL